MGQSSSKKREIPRVPAVRPCGTAACLIRLVAIREEEYGGHTFVRLRMTPVPAKPLVALSTSPGPSRTEQTVCNRCGCWSEQLAAPRSSAVLLCNLNRGRAPCLPRLPPRATIGRERNGTRAISINVHNTGLFPFFSTRPLSVVSFVCADAAASGLGEPTGRRSLPAPFEHCRTLLDRSDVVVSSVSWAGPSGSAWHRAGQREGLCFDSQKGPAILKRQRPDLCGEIWEPGATLPLQQ
jgi:hypothetical protein